jgi:hypothetical protein
VLLKTAMPLIPVGIKLLLMAWLKLSMMEADGNGWRAVVRGVQDDVKKKAES